jgi:hypothetical protein
MMTIISVDLESLKNGKRIANQVMPSIEGFQAMRAATKGKRNSQRHTEYLIIVQLVCIFKLAG